MEEIRNYLDQEDKNYQDGVSILSKYCPNRMLVNSLAKKESAAHWQKLEHELKKALALQPEPKFEPVANLTAPDQPTGKGEITGMSVDESQLLKNPPAPALQAYVHGHNSDVDALIADRSRLYNERCILSNSLADAETDEQRQEIIAKIDAIEAARASIKEKVQYFEQYGKLPEVKAAQVDTASRELDKADLIKTRNNLRSQLSKAKKAVVSKPDDVKKQEKLAKVEVELNSVELQLKQIADAERAEAGSAGNE